ncbi:MAG: glycosyltransferase family 2 protein [Bacteroidota bacterium]
MNKQLISVIMPAYNCEKYVAIAIDSVLNQTYTNFELLIADDCSTDGTKKIIDSYSDSRIKKYHNSINLGYLKSCNLLFQKANGQLVTFLDADDINALNRFTEQVDFLIKNADFSMVGTNIIRIDSDGKETGKSNFKKDYNSIKQNFIDYRVPCHYSSLLIKMGAIKEVGLYNEYFDRVGSEDIYWFSLLVNNHKVANLEQHLYYYRKHPTSVTATHKKPKAFVGHELIMKMYFRRNNNKTDFIVENKNWSVADIYVDFLVEIRNLKMQSKKMSSTLFSLCLKHPIIATDFLKEIKNLSFYKS